MVLLKGNQYWLWRSENDRKRWIYVGGEKDVRSDFGEDGPFDAIARWDENGVHYFFQGEYYWRLLNGKLVHKASISDWTGLVDSGVELLRNCPCSCSRAGHNENWKFKAIKYDVDNAVVKKKELRSREAPMESNLLGVSSCNNECSNQKKTKEYINTQKETFTSTTTLGLKIGTSFKVGIPSIASVGIKVELSVSQAFTFGKENLQSKSVSYSFQCFGLPRRYTVCPIRTYGATMDVPYTMTLQHKTKGCECPSKGNLRIQNEGWLEMEARRFTSVRDAKKFLAEYEIGNKGK